MSTDAKRLYDLTMKMLDNYQEEINNSHTGSILLRNQIMKTKIASCLELIKFDNPVAELTYIKQILKWGG